jgi:phage recombination protein Bet
MNVPTTAITTTKPSALAAMSARFNVEPAKLLDTLKQTVFKNATDAQLMALVIVANEAGLNPFAKEIYAFPGKTGGIEPVISVDGWFKRINSHEAYDGMEKEFVTGADGKPYSCTVTLHRKDRKFPTKHTELYSECFRNTEPWKNQPHRMLGHRATIQCARIAFGFAGADPEEAERVFAPTTPEIRKPLFATAVEVGPADQIPGAEVPDKPRRGRPPKAPAIEQEAPATEPEPTEPVYESPKDPNTPNEDLAEFVTVTCTASFDNFTAALVNMQWAKGAAVDVWTGFEDVPLAMVQHCLKRKDALGARLEDEKAMNQGEA